MVRDGLLFVVFFFFQAEDGIRDLVRSRGLGDVYKRQDRPRARPLFIVERAITTALINGGRPRLLVIVNQKNRSYGLVPPEYYAF